MAVLRITPQALRSATRTRHQVPPAARKAVRFRNSPVAQSHNALTSRVHAVYSTDIGFHSSRLVPAARCVGAFFGVIMPSILRRVVSGLTPRSRNPRSEETVAKPWQDELFDIDHLQKEAERYRSEARHAATDEST